MIRTDIDLVGAWSTFWSTVSGAISGPVKTTLVVVGIGLILFTVVKFLWDKRRGNGGRHGPIWWTLIFGAVLISPDVLLPLILGILQWVINLALKVVTPIWGGQ
jgi:hypothetical protein